MGKLGFMVGFGAGYVLGAKAGQERYDQLKRLYDNLISSPQAKKVKSKARETAESGFEQARSKASEKAHWVQEAVRERRGDSDSGLSVAPPPSS